MFEFVRCVLFVVCVALLLLIGNCSLLFVVCCLLVAVNRLLTVVRSRCRCCVYCFVLSCVLFAVWC